MLPQYEISEIIGRGGMGAVYQGRQAKLNRPVAIKLLPETFAKGEDELNFAKRFEQEAQAMAHLDHPAILSVYDYGETDKGQLYFVMEFADGMDVHQYLHHHGGKLTQESALTITAHVLDALDYAHRHGIAHRDIKPANILLTQEGRVKIADFGLAKKFGEHIDVSSPTLTLANVAFGTPDFVAPETLDSDQIPDHRADLYAVGVMLYQMLTGKLPRGNFQLPSRLDAGIDERLDDIVNKAMAADPGHRYQSAAAVRADLDLVLSQPLARIETGEASGNVAAAVPVTTSVRGGKAASKLPVVLGIGVAAVLVVGLIVMATKKSSPAILPVPSTAKTAEAEQMPVTGKPGIAPAENIAIVPMAREGESSIDIPPTPSAEITAEPEQTRLAPKLGVAPLENTGQMPEPQEEKSAVPVLAAASTAPAAPILAAAPVPTENTGEMPVPRSQTPPASPPLPVPAPPTENPLSAIPGVKSRLDAYHTARRAQLADLAGKYLGGLEARLDQAADAGDLKLATAYGDEKTRVEALQQILAAPPADPVVAVDDESVRTLPALPEGSPETLAALRQTWTEESAKIHADLDGKLGQSLQALEVELTKARDFESANTVLAWRESLGEEKASAPPADLAAAMEAGGMVVLQPDLASATKDAPFKNSLGMKFVPVRGTDVLFCIHETRWRDYEEYATKTKESVEGSWKMQTNQGFQIKTDGENHPVTHMNWHDAQAFCRWISEKEGKTYRLPTDREWSLAVGIGRGENWKRDTTPATVFLVPDEFPWGDEWPPPKGAGNYSDESRRTTIPQDDANYVEGGYDDGIPTTAPVMSFEANTLGLFDLGGNVWEWCEDWYSDEQKDRVLRGASWHNYNRESMLSSYRGHRTPDGRSGNGGFRIVLEIAAGSPPSAAGR